jgi:hypothetical protein
MGVFFVAQAETRGFSMGFPRENQSPMIRNSPCLLVVIHHLLRVLPNFFLSPKNEQMSQIWPKHGFTIIMHFFFIQSDGQMRTRAKEQGELFIFRTSNGGAKKRATNCEIFPSTWWFFTNTNVWQMRIYPTAWRLGFHLIVFPHSESTLPPPAVWRSRNRRCCAHGFQTGEIGGFWMGISQWYSWLWKMTHF